MITAKTILFGDRDVPLHTRDWKRTRERHPYRKTYLLKPGDRWHDAPTSTDIWEHYVDTPEGAVPVGSLIAKEFVQKGASTSLFTECFGRGRCVFMSPELVCVDIDGDFGEILQSLKAANGNKWAGLPDAIAYFPEGDIVMVDAKVAKKDTLSQTQHTFARIASSILGSRLQLGVVEWGYETT